MRRGASNPVMSGCTDDQGLIEACRAGETEAYGILVRRYQDRLYPTLLRLTGCAEDAQDLLQETFLRAWRHADRLCPQEGSASLMPWLATVARRIVLNDRQGKEDRAEGLTCLGRIVGLGDRHRELKRCCLVGRHDSVRD